VKLARDSAPAWSFSERRARSGWKLSEILTAEGASLNGLTEITPLAISDDGNVVVGSATLAAAGAIPAHNVAFLARWR
jgi:hypothetical protein